MNNTGIRMKINLNILPFGQAIITIKCSEVSSEKKEQSVVYSEPRTTERSVTEVNFTEDSYFAPETTVGLLL